MISPETLIDAPPKYGRAEVFLAHFEEIGVEPDTIAIDRYLNIIGSGWHVESTTGDSGASMNALVRPLPRKIDDYGDDSYLAKFEEQDGDMRATSNGLEIRAEKLGVRELRAALELEKVCSPALAFVEEEEDSIPETIDDEVQKHINESEFSPEAKRFLEDVPYAIYRAIAYLKLPTNEDIAEKVGVRPKTVKAYIYEARKTQGLDTKEELFGFLNKNGLLIDI